MRGSKAGSSVMRHSMNSPELNMSGDASMFWNLIPDSNRKYAYDHRFDDRKTVEILIGCLPECVHRLPDVIAESEDRHPIFRNHVKYINISPGCAQSEACAARRKEIFDRAYNESNAEFDRYKSFWRAMKAKKTKWNEIVSEYYDVPCPFFENNNIT